MIAINLQEKEAITKKYPNVHIVRTMKQDSRRHHYYMVEERGPMSLLRSLRGFGGKNGHKRNRRSR